MLGKTKINKTLYWASLALVTRWGCCSAHRIVLLVDIREVYLKGLWLCFELRIIWRAVLIQHIQHGYPLAFSFHFAICLTIRSNQSFKSMFHPLCVLAVKVTGKEKRKGRKKEKKLSSKDSVQNECTDIDSVTPYMSTTIHQRGTGVERASPDSLNDPCLRQPSRAKQREKEKERRNGITGTTQGWANEAVLDYGKCIPSRHYCSRLIFISLWRNRSLPRRQDYSNYKDRVSLARA